MSKRVVIVGAGIGGLASAARLAHAGFDVTVLEKELVIGGRCGTLNERGFSWDIGPTILLFPEILRDHFRAVGEDAREALTLTRCDPNSRIHFRDATSITMRARREDMRAALEAFAPGSANQMEAFWRSADQKKKIAFDTFLSRPFERPSDMLRPSALRGVLESESYRSLYAIAAKYVTDRRLRMALTYQTMYLGISPFDAPAMFGLLPATETDEGIWYVRGGLGAITVALTALAERKGARIRTGAKVVAFDRSRSGIHAVRLDDGTWIPADIVLTNADLPYVRRELLRDPLPSRYRYTSSALMFYWACEGASTGLLHHNVFFGGTYREAFTDLFERHQIPADPPFYVANPVVSDESVAPAGMSALYVLVPVPHLVKGGIDWRNNGIIDGVREKIIGRMERSAATNIRKSIQFERTMTPLDWQDRYSLEHGSAFGLSHTLSQVGGFRPPNRHPSLSNLFFVGASTQPATGIPNVLIGAKQVSDRIQAECG